MNLRLRQRHSSTHWELEIERAEGTKVIHFHQGLGLLGQCNQQAVLDKIEIQSWYKIQARIAEVKPDPGCVWIAFQMSHLPEEVAAEVLDTMSRDRRLPLDFFLTRSVPALPSYVEISNWFQRMPKPSWKFTELERFASYRRELLDVLYRSIIRSIEPPEIRPPEQDFMRDATDEQLLTRAQQMLESHALYQVRLANNGWVSVLLTLDSEEAFAKHADFDELGSSAQTVTLNPSARDQRLWQVINRNGGTIYMKCQQTQAYGILDIPRLSPVDSLYLSVNPDFKKELYEAEPGYLWPLNHNFLVDLLCEEKAFIWGDLWQLQTVSGAKHRLQLKHYRDTFPMVEVEPGIFKLPAQTNQEGLSRALHKAGYCRREPEGRIKLIDPELRMELGI